MSYVLLGYNKVRDSLKESNDKCLFCNIREDMKNLSFNFDSSYDSRLLGISQVISTTKIEDKAIYWKVEGNSAYNEDVFKQKFKDALAYDSDWLRNLVRKAIELQLMLDWDHAGISYSFINESISYLQELIVKNDLWLPEVEKAFSISNDMNYIISLCLDIKTDYTFGDSTLYLQTISSLMDDLMRLYKPLRVSDENNEKRRWDFSRSDLW